MAGITFTSRGNFKKTGSLFARLVGVDKLLIKTFQKYGEMGVQALRESTPKDTGKTADSWSYEIQNGPEGVTISWKNNNQNDGRLIAVLLRYGHGTKNGGYVKGIDYISPAMKPVFDKILAEAWEEVSK